MTFDLNLLVIPIPMIIGFATAFNCRPGKDAGSNVAFRPPSWVFSTIWPILYLLFGLGWYFSLKKSGNITLVHIMNIALTVLLALWLVVYGCGKDKKGAAFVLLACIATALMVFAVNSTVGKLLVAPLVAWLIFALLLNTQEVTNESSAK